MWVDRDGQEEAISADGTKRETRRLAMSYDESDARDDAMVESMYASFFDDQSVRDAFHESLYDEIVGDFTDARLRSFFGSQPDAAVPAAAALDDARTLRAVNETASFIFASTAMEVGLRITLLQPIVYGLVHTDSAAALITRLAIATKDANLVKILLDLLAAHGSVDPRTHRRGGSPQTLWEEQSTITVKRNRVMHRAERASGDDADFAIAVAATILDELFPTLVANLGLFLHGRVVRTTRP